MKMHRIFIFASILNCLCAAAQKPIGIVYYDLDKLYDTIPSLFYNDTNYTPTGKLQWNNERYQRKIRHTAAVIDTLCMPFTALYGVENETVVRDIVTACREDYSYVHRTQNSLNGMDFTLLYYGDLFSPTCVESGRSYLYVEGDLRGEQIGVLMSCDSHYAAWALRDLREERPGVKLLVLGRSSTVKCEALGLRDASAAASRAGRGNVRSRSGWYMRDRILADTALRISDGDVHVRRYLIDVKNGYPSPTYIKEHYKGGYSYALPVFIYLK